MFWFNQIFSPQNKSGMQVYPRFGTKVGNSKRNRRGSDRLTWNPYESLEQRLALAINVIGDITSDQTWTDLTQPYCIVGNVDIKPGVTLNIAPGVRVQTAAGGLNPLVMDVNGTLNASGALFQANTNIVVKPGGTASFVESCSFDGLQIRFDENSFGEISDSTFLGAKLSVFSDVTINANTFNNANPIATNPVFVPEFYDNTFTSQSSIDVSGTLQSDSTWQVINNLRNYRVVGDLNIPFGVKLTIPTGVEVFTTQAVSGSNTIEVRGTLDATGVRFSGNFTDLNVLADGKLFTNPRTRFIGGNVTLNASSSGTIRNTEFRGNLTIHSSSSYVFTGNSIRGSVSAIGPGGQIDLRNQYWGIIDPVAIEEMITHQEDESSLPLVLFDPAQASLPSGYATPFLSPIADQLVPVNRSLSAIPFTVYDAETLPADLTVTVNSSNLTLIPNANIVITGNNVLRTLQLTPLANRFGTSNIEIRVSDGSFLASYTFKLTVVNAVSLASNVLTINGSDFDDVINVKQPGQVEVNWNGYLYPFAAATIQTIIVNAFEGNDIVRVESIASPFNLVLNGGKGDDQLLAGSLTRPVVLNGNEGNDLLEGGISNDTLDGGTGDDSLKGLAGNDRYLFNSGLAYGNDTITESAGIDTVDFSAGSVGVTVNLALTTQQTYAPDSRLTLPAGFAIENLVGSEGNDTLLGSPHSNRIDGRGGNDSITGASGSDELIGGLGNDRFVFNPDLNPGADSISDGSGIDTIDFSQGSLGIQLNLAFATPQNYAASSSVVLIGQTIENVRGTSGNDIIFGNSLNNTIEGLGGNDVLVNSGGSDVLDGSIGNDWYIFKGGLGFSSILDSSGVDSLNFAEVSNGISVDLGITSEQLLFGGALLKLDSAISIENVIGSQFDDLILGNPKDNFLSGQGGNDTYRFNADSGQGTDTISDSAGWDRLDFSNGRMGVTADLGIAERQRVNSNLSLILSSTSAIESVVGSRGDDILNGNELNNRLSGLTGKDIIVGRGGNDELLGGEGDDFFIFDGDVNLGTDKIFETSGLDFLDFISTSTSGIRIDLRVSTAQVVIPGKLSIELGSAAESIEGVRGTINTDVISGNGLANILVGLAGNDYLWGHAGRDVMIGGTGQDFMAGGADDDLLIAYATTHETNLSNLILIGTEWNSTNSYETRVNRLTSVNPLLVSGLTVSDRLSESLVPNTIYGMSERDWFFANPGIEEMLDRVSGEFVS